VRIQIARKAMLLILIITVLNVAVRTNTVISNEQPVQLKWSYKFANETGDIAMSSDGKYVIVGGYPSPLHFFNTSEASEPLWSFNVSRGHVETLSISSNGSYIVAGNVGGSYYERYSTVYLLSSVGNLLWALNVTSNHVYTAISPDGKYVAALGGGLGGGTLYLLSSVGSLQWTYGTNVYGDVYQVLFSRNSTYLYVGTTQGILVFDLMNGQFGPIRFLLSEYGDHFSVSEDEKDIACVLNSHVKLYKGSTLSWDFQTREEMRGVDLSADGRALIAGGIGRGGIGPGGVVNTQPGNLYFFRDRTLMGNYSTGDIPAVSGRSPVSISSDGKFVAAGSEDGVVYFFELFFDEGGFSVIPWWIWWVLGTVTVVAVITAVLWMRKHFRIQRLK
jgi:WD40 repeat protein